MLMSTDVASIMLPVSRGIMDRERDIDTTSGPLANVAVSGQAAAAAAAAAAAVRGMKRGDPEPDAQTAAALSDLAGAECKRPRIDGTGSVVGEIGQVRRRMVLASNCCYYCREHNCKISGTPPILSSPIFPVFLTTSFVPSHQQGW